MLRVSSNWIFLADFGAESFGDCLAFLSDLGVLPDDFGDMVDLDFGEALLVFLVLLGDPLAGRLAGSPKWTFSDSFSVVRLSSVLDRGLTYVLQTLKKC